MGGERGLPVEGAVAVEHFEVEGGDCLAIEFAVLGGLHCHCGVIGRISSAL